MKGYGGQATDELGLPVQQPSKVPAYLFLVFSVVCATVSGVIWMYVALIESDTHRDFSRPLDIAAGVIGLLPLVGVRKIPSFEKVLGTRAGSVLGLAVAAAALCGFFQLAVGILPHAACSPDCGGA